MTLTRSVGKSGIPRLQIETRRTKFPGVQRVAGQNAYFVGEGKYGGKTRGLLYLGSWDLPVQPSVTLRTDWIRDEGGGCVREFTEADLETVRNALSLIGFKKGPLAVRSDHMHESMGIGFSASGKAPTNFANPAGLLATQLMLYDPAQPEANDLLADAIEGVCRSRKNPDFTAFRAKYNLEPRRSSVLLQPFIHASSPFKEGYIHPYYSAIVDTARHDMIRVCVGFGSGTFAFNRRGQGYVHRYDPHTLTPVEEQAKGGQSHFETLDNKGCLARLQFTSYFGPSRLSSMREFFNDPTNFTHLAKIGQEMTVRYPMGIGICVEIAAADPTSEPKLLQLNPVRKMSHDFPQPEVDREDVLYRTPYVIGQGERKLNGVVVVIVPEAYEKASVDLHGELEKLNQQMKDYLLIIPGLLTSQGSGTAMKYRLFSNAATVLEYGSDIHETGTGMDHFTRICNTGGIFYIESMFQYFTDLRTVMGKKLEPLKQVSGVGVHRIDTDTLPFELHLWIDEEADDGHGDGMIYRKPRS